MKEIWKDVDDAYEVSSFGNVRNLRTGRLKKLEIDRSGYHTVRLYHNKNSRIIYVHRLVAKAFIKNPLEKAQVNHINGDKLDNSIDNLEWATQSENLRHAALVLGRSLGGRKAIPVLCVETGERYRSIGEAARETGLSKGHIAKALSHKEGRTQTGGFHWAKV